MSGNATFGRGLCPTPFLQEELFTSKTGYVTGRFCQTVNLNPVVTCCLPCPQTEWLYPDNFQAITKGAGWVNVVSMACSAFLLISFAVLPVSKTHRHYLSICLAMATVLMQLGFIIPLGAKPNECYDAITPNDMQTSPTCALSGAFLLIGGWSGVMWVFLRAVALHLQICWQVVIGKTFMWGALATGWGIPAIGLAVALIFSGVSFRFGDTCHINHKNSLADFWIPLLAFAAITVVIQFATFGYCIKVYLASLVDDSTTTNSSGLPSYTTSLRGTISPRQAYRRVRRVIELQWRGIFIVLLIIADVIFFAIIFVFMDDIEQNMMKNPAKAATWLGCLEETGGDKNACLKYTSDLVINEATVMAVLLLLSMMGIWCFFLLGRFSMFQGWYELIRGTRRPDVEFVSADVRALKDTNTYEMLSRDREGTGKTPDQMISLSSFASPTPLSPPEDVKRASGGMNGRETPDYFGREARYKSPARSFSRPGVQPNHVRGESGRQTPEWDPTTTQARPFVFPPREGNGLDPLGMNKI